MSVCIDQPINLLGVVVDGMDASEPRNLVHPAMRPIVSNLSYDERSAQTSREGEIR